MIKGIFFDVGGTLYSYAGMYPAIASVLKEVASRLQLEHQHEELARHYLLANKDVDRLFSERPFYLFRDYSQEIFEGFLARVGSPHLNGHFDWFESYHRETVVGSIELRPDCHDTLERLKAMGLYLSAVSNADNNQLLPLIERGQLARWLTHWTSSEEARSCKPDRRFFDIALQKSGLRAAEVLFVGDSLEQDIQGAHAVGMTTALIADVGPAPMHIGRETPDPDFRISRLEELPDIIAKLNS